jgi:hypothetical protein
MAISQWLGIGAAALLVVFIAFAFRQGERVRPSGNDPNRGEDIGEGGSPGGHSSGHSGGESGSP